MTKYLLGIFCSLALLTGSAYAAEGVALPEVTKTGKNAFEVMYSDAETAVAEALTAKGVGDKVSAVINGHKFGAIFAYEKPVEVKTRGLQFDKQSGRWSASLIFEADGDVVSALPVSGHFDEMVEVPVLKREVRSGDTIQGSDIEVRDFAINHTRSDTVNDLSSLIGKTPLRSISPYRPIRTTELSTPAVIKKDGIVQMHYSMPGMEISTSGQAMSAGAPGDVINVRNMNSKKIVRAVVLSSDSVNIPAINQETSSLVGDAHAAN